MLRTKSAFLIGIIVLLVFTVSAASAETTFTMTTLNEPGDVPSGTGIYFGINVTYNADTNQIIFEENSTGLSDPRITLIAYNFPANASIIDAYDINGDELAIEIGDWTETEGKAVDGFGKFARVYDGLPGNIHPTKVVVTLEGDPDFVEEIDKTTDYDSNKFTDGFEVAAHFVWDEPAADTGATSIKIAGPGEGTIGPEGEIPEFPSIALPVAAIMGIMFLFGRRKTE